MSRKRCGVEADVYANVYTYIYIYENNMRVYIYIYIYIYIRIYTPTPHPPLILADGSETTKKRKIINYHSMRDFDDACCGGAASASLDSLREEGVRLP